MTDKPEKSVAGTIVHHCLFLQVHRHLFSEGKIYFPSNIYKQLTRFGQLQPPLPGSGSRRTISRCMIRERVKFARNKKKKHSARIF